MTGGFITSFRGSCPRTAPPGARPKSACHGSGLRAGRGGVPNAAAALGCRGGPVRGHPRVGYETAWKHLILSLLAVAALSAAPDAQTFNGIITDNMCGKAGHSQMQMGPTDAECTVACISAHGATYVLYDGRDVYTLSDQQTPEKFAAQKVRVVGTLDAKTNTIQVDSISAAN